MPWTFVKASNLLYKPLPHPVLLETHTLWLVSFFYLFELSFSTRYFPLKTYGLKQHCRTSSFVVDGSAGGDPRDASAHLSPFLATSPRAPISSYPENSYHPANLLPDFCLWFFRPVGWRMYMWECLAHGRLTPSACQLNSHPASLFTKAAL